MTQPMDFPNGNDDDAAPKQQYSQPPKSKSLQKSIEKKKAVPITVTTLNGSNGLVGSSSCAGKQ